MTYEELCSFDTLWDAYVRARRCKRSKGSTAAFEYSAIEELLILSKSLLQGTFQPDPLDAFLIYEPKKRLIQAPTFRDKVVQHALTDYVVYDELSRSLTRNTYAAQVGKGVHFGLKMLEQHMRTHFLRKKGADEAARRAAGLPHRPMEEWDYAEGAVIKGDIRHFFQSIGHDRLKAALAKRFQDRRILELMFRYIDEVSDGLELNNKTNIFPLQNGIDFCGFHTYLTKSGKVVKKLRYASIKRMKRRIRLWERQYAAGEITREKIMECFGSWEAHAKHGDTRQLRTEMRARLEASLARAAPVKGTPHPYGSKAADGCAEVRRRGRAEPARSPATIHPQGVCGIRKAAEPPTAAQERRSKRYGTVTFQSCQRQPGQAE